MSTFTGQKIANSYKNLLQVNTSNSDLSSTYKVAIQPISQSWTEGVGKLEDNPKTTNGCSWANRSKPVGGSAVSWANVGGSVYPVSHSVQSFSNQTPWTRND